MRHYTPCFALLGAVTCLAPVAAAYQTDSVVSDNCHEAITFDALATLRERVELRPPPSPSRNERALIEDAPFPVPRGLRDLAAVTLALANREVDLRGLAPDDLDQLSPLHGNPRNQAPHCLRAPDHDGTEGDLAALAACRAFIRENVDDALDGLDEEGQPDYAKRTKLDVYLDLRGSIEAELPTYYARMGRALHALQDGFSHSYRTEDSLSVTAVLNYVDYVEERLAEGRDGPAHSSPMDQCIELDAFRQQRFETATRASAELLSASLSEGDREQKLAAVDAVLDRYFTYQAGCTEENDWCNAPERQYPEGRGCVCSAGKTTASGGAPWALPAVLAAGLVARRRRSAGRRNRRKTFTVAGGFFAALSLSLYGRQAQAQDADPGVEPVEPAAADPSVAPADSAPAVDPIVTTPPPVQTTPPPTVTPTDGEVTSADAAIADEPVERFPFGVYVAGGAGVQNTALAASLGLRFRLGEHWLFGADAEYNPWIVRRSGEFRSGVANFYATAILRFPMRFEKVNLRSTVHAGVSRLLFDLYGAPEGSMGPYFGVNFLGVDIELARSVYLVVDPADVSIPIPQTTGVPLVYPQYRFTVGLQLGG